MEFPDHRRIGTVLKPHGIRGEFLVYLESDFPEWVARQKRLFALVGGTLQEWTVSSARVQQGRIVMKVQELADRTAVENARGTVLLVTEAAARAANTDPEFYFNSDLIGLTVLSDGVSVGVVRDVLEMPGQNLLEIDRPEGGTFLFPFAKDLIKDMDLEARTLNAIIPEGLIELNENKS